MLRLGGAGLGSSPVAQNLASPASVLLPEAVEIYLTQKGKGRPITFRRGAQRACGYVIDTCGDKYLYIYTKADANNFRDALIARGLAGSSLTRVFGTVRAVTNFAASEQGLSLNNPFSGVYYDRSAGVSGRSAIPSEALVTVQAKCRELDDELRWLVALVSDIASSGGTCATSILNRTFGTRLTVSGPTCFLGSTFMHFSSFAGQKSLHVRTFR